MQVEAMSVTGTPMQQAPKASESVDTGRKNLEKGEAEQQQTAFTKEKSVQAEEILGKIKALTEDGLYSVRFESNQEFDSLVVKVVDNETDEVIRQVPAEEVLGMKASLEEYRGQLVNTVK
ncbi:flagellar protein FlaG [Desulforhopalus sp. IMCC35007]|uniref:flagellar protein FlaG n=1 Tax=Desulforhopalus sp. IMCC35007 TaxID=2569543 RepID=UPI0010AE9402|nr:flagellar protein FlaG [Desulforhopalus sp. IMCC35007]TKB10258.1 flagellar protein FlaG [Desulforhopalus sp. IMCC35007]